MLSSQTQEFLSALGLLLMRLWFGGAMLVAHGWPKLSDFANKAETFPDPLGIGSTASLSLTVLAEVVGAMMLMLGIGTRFVSLALLVTMLVAAFVIHAHDPWTKQEFALLYAAGYLGLMLTGPGRLSLDHVVTNRQSGWY